MIRLDIFLVAIALLVEVLAIVLYIKRKVSLWSLILFPLVSISILILIFIVMIFLSGEM